jgi:hypothetical protein
MRIIFILAVILWFAPVAASVNSSDTVRNRIGPSYIQSQYAGNLGLVSFGYSRDFFNNTLSIGLFYGILPKFINRCRVNTIALKPAIQFNEFYLLGRKTNCYLGISINYALASNTYLKYPDYYIDGYYKSNAIHFNPFIGAGICFPVHYKICNNIILYSELGSVDYLIWYAIINREVSFAEIWNLSFGLTFQLK